MSPDVEKIIEGILALPVRLKHPENLNRSMSELLRETGYCRYMKAIGASEILQVLEKSANVNEIVDGWLAYSEDKRTSDGWALQKLSDGSGEISRIGDYRLNVTYRNFNEACAQFIARDLSERDWLKCLPIKKPTRWLFLIAFRLRLGWLLRLIFVRG